MNNKKVNVLKMCWKAGSEMIFIALVITLFLSTVFETKMQFSQVLLKHFQKNFCNKHQAYDYNLFQIVVNKNVAII